MAFVNAILFLSYLFLQLTIVTARISSEECGSEPNDIKLLNLTVSPDPIVAPGSVSIIITIYTNQNITSPLKARLSLEKRILLMNIPVPCSIIGSCEYDDLCAICTQCNCPMEAGEHTLNLPITIDSSSWMFRGNYQAKINLETSLGEKGCVKINNIYITTNK